MLDVTDARRDVIYDVLVGRPGLSPGEVVQAIEQRLKDWPRATWANAVQEPYYLGIAQHLTAMERLGEVERKQPGSGFKGEWFAVVPRPARKPRGPSVTEQRRKNASALRSSRIAAVKELVEGPEDLSYDQIGKKLGISASYAHELYTDPEGLKRRRCFFCKRAIKEPSENEQVCEPCHQDYLTTLLPPLHFERFITMGQRVGIEVVFGVTPEYDRVIRQGTERGMTEYVLDDRERWEEAVFHLGFVAR